MSAFIGYVLAELAASGGSAAPRRKAADPDVREKEL
jgi:hypothetical protein